MLKILEKLAFYPLPLRVVFFKKLLQSIELAPYEKRLEYDALPRPHYGYCIYNAACLANVLGYPKISVIEFGVAEGDGLTNIEHHIRQIRRTMDIEFTVYGFDSGHGLPKPKDYRDLPYKWHEGFYKMDRKKLEKDLAFSILIMGDTRDTCSSFFDAYKPPPIGAVLFDLDYYSPTTEAFNIFKTDHNNLLPRVYCYFDDITGEAVSAYNEYTGELLAIREFNEKNTDRKIARINGLSEARKIPQGWNEKIFAFHDFLHPLYNELVTDPDAPWTPRYRR